MTEKVETETGTIARHAGTVLVGQLAVMAFGVTDTIVAGRFSDRALAALSVGSAGTHFGPVLFVMAVCWIISGTIHWAARQALQDLRA